MPVSINGQTGVITGLAVGGLPDGIIQTADLADDAVTIAKLSTTGTASGTTFLRGDGAFAAAGGGKVLQVVEGSTTTAVTLSTTTYSDIGITANITPQTNSKVLVLVNFAHNMNSSLEEGFGIKLLRGSTALYTSPSQGEFYAYTASSGQFINRAVFHYYDTAPSGDGSTALTYKIQAATFSSRQVDFVVSGARSTITLIEIGA